MPVVLDPDAAAVYKAFQDAGRPAYETLTAPEAREFYNQARFVSNPEPPALESAKDIAIPAPARQRSRPGSTHRRRCARRTALRHASCSSMAAAG